jgi:hypothetical protein
MKRLFIIGCPRSGTTWAGLLLAQHPEIEVCQQVSVVTTMNRIRGWWAAGEASPQVRYLGSVVRFGPEDEAPTFEQLMSEADMREVCRSVADLTYGHVARRNPRCQVVVDKTPENVRHPDVMLEMMPDAYFLHLIRDPRSVYASHRNGSKDFGALFPTDPAGSATYWTSDVKRGRRLGELTPNYRELRYESLKENGRAELTGIIEWLGLTVDPAWCDAVLAKTSIEKLQVTKGTPKNFFRAGKAEGWRTELTSRQLHAVEFYARELMTDLGYEPVHPRSSQKPPGMVVRDALSRITARVKRAT